MARKNKIDPKDLASINKKIGKYRDAIALVENSKNEVSNLSSIVTQASESAQKLTQITTETNSTLENIKQISTEINSFKDSIVQSSKEAQEQKDQIVILESKVSEQLTKLEDAEKNLNEMQEKTMALKEEVSRQLSVATGGTLASSFDKRQKGLWRGSFLWFLLLILSGGGLCLWVTFIVGEIISKPLSSPIQYLLKITITFPLIYLVFLLASIFQKQRELADEYAFKSTLALSLGAYQKLVVELTQGEQKNDKAVEFLTKSIDIIYSPIFSQNKKTTPAIKKERDLLDQIISLLPELVKLKTTNP